MILAVAWLPTCCGFSARYVSSRQHAPVDTTQPLAVQSEWDSLRQIEFIVRLEQHFHLKLTEADLLHASTVGAVISMLEAKRGRS